MQMKPIPSAWNMLENMGKPKRLLSTLAMAGGLALAASAMAPDALAQTASKKPNILVIFGDDIGMWNVGAYTHASSTYFNGFPPATVVHINR